MNLEKVEERCLSYLRQSPNPLVPMPALLEHIRRDEQCVNLEAALLQDFLKDHEQVTLIALPTLQALEGQDPAQPTELGHETRAILNIRVPAPHELAQLMDLQMDTLIKALRQALSEAEERKDETRQIQIREAIDRSELLQQRMRSLL